MNYEYGCQKDEIKTLTCNITNIAEGFRLSIASFGPICITADIEI